MSAGMVPRAWGMSPTLEPGSRDALGLGCCQRKEPGPNPAVEVEIERCLEARPIRLDLAPQADLGIDTVKQAEMFAAIREIYNIPRDENRKLRDYPTLAHVIRFVHDRLFSRHRFRQKLASGFSCAAEIVATDALAIDRECECFAHAHVVERLTRSVEGVISQRAVGRAAKVFVWREQLEREWFERRVRDRIDPS